MSVEQVFVDQLRYHVCVRLVFSRPSSSLGPFFKTFNPLYQILSENFFVLAYANQKCLYETKEQLLATDILVLATMKNAAKCDT